MGFMCGVYLGTRYDLEPYVNKIELSISKIANDLEKKRKAKEQPQDIKEVEDVHVQSDSSVLSWFFNGEKKSQQ